jgi:K+-sensing histidine kinase KdpD
MMPRDPKARVSPDGGSASRGGRRPAPTTDLDSAGSSKSNERDHEAFLDILSHELRTPVTTIYGGAELLATHDLEPERRQALAADVRVEAERLYRLVEDLVILARSERGEIRPIGEPVALGRLVTAAVEREIARHPEIRIHLLGASDAAADAADEVLVAHVLRNLLDNAIRYGGSAGPIEVIVGGSPTEVTVRIIDRGESPPLDARPFGLSADPPRTAAGRAGAGIGLYVASRLVEAMHGRMWALHSDDVGAEFGFALARSDGGRAAYSM